MLKSLKKQGLTGRNHTSEDKLVPVILVLGSEMQRLTRATFQDGLNIFDLVAQDAIKTNREVDMPILIAEPNHTHVCYYQTSSIPIIALSIFNIIH